eukprot:tig00000704_g3300.t1
MSRGRRGQAPPPSGASEVPDHDRPRLLFAFSSRSAWLVTAVAVLVALASRPSTAPAPSFPPPAAPAAADQPTAVARAFASVPANLSVFFARTITDPSFIFAVDSTDLYINSRSIVMTSLYAPRMSALFKQLAAGPCGAAPPSARPLVVDVGANLGYFSALAASLGCEVQAFEPQHALHPFFALTAAANGFERRVTLHRLAVTSRSGRRLALQRHPNSGSAQVLDAGAGGRPALATLASTSLDDHFKNETRDILLLKIDIEGHELEALRGAEGLLAARRVAHVLVELKRDAQEGEKLAWLRRAREVHRYATYSIPEEYMGRPAEDAGAAPFEGGWPPHEDVWLRRLHP